MDDFQTLLHAYLDRELTDGQRRALMAWLAEDPGHVERFVFECYLHSQLQDIFIEERIASEALALQSEMQLAGFRAMDVEPLLESVPAAPPPASEPASAVPSPTEPEEFGLPPVPGFDALGDAVRNITQVGVLPYLAFATLTLLVCLAVQLVWEWSLSDDRELAARRPSGILSTRERVLAGVGHISGMTDCRWANNSRSPGFFDRVEIGQRIALSAGLLEITYDSGFKAILQGPVEYEVTSRNGGFLAIGKLTGKATAARARGFTVDTPLARVIDLGTEFGAEVAPDGAVATVVFTGEVELTPTTPEGKHSPGQVLRKGEAARVLRGPGASNPFVQLVSAVLADRFTRTMPPSPVQVLIGPTECNGSFEEPAIGPANCDPAASDPAAKVYTKQQGITPRFWNSTFALRTKGTRVEGVTGNQHAVLQSPSFVVFSTRLDGSDSHPPLCTFAPKTIYVLTADLGGSDGDMKAHMGLDDGTHAVRQTVTVAAPEVLEPVPALVLNTDVHPEFVGKPIGVSFMKADSSLEKRLYLDNVVLRAFPSSP